TLKRLRSRSTWDKIELITDHHFYTPVFRSLLSFFICAQPEGPVVDQASIFTNLGEPLSLEAINEEAVDDMTVGELAFASAFFSQRLSERLAQPESLAEIATFHKATGADWSGHETQRIGEDASSREPVAPQNHVDTFPALMAIMAKQERTQEAAMTNLVRKLDVGIKSQEAYLGVPEGIRGFRETKEVLRQTLRMSGHRANRILAR